MQAKIDKTRVLSLLDEWSSIQGQRRLWLSDGTNGAEVSSFEEAREQLFTDTGLWRDLESGQPVFGEPADSELKRLDALCSRMGSNRAPQQIIDDEGMREIRSTAAGLLSLLRA